MARFFSWGRPSVALLLAGQRDCLGKSRLYSESRAYKGLVGGTLVSRCKLLHVLIGLPADSLRSPAARALRRGRRACARPDRAAVRCAGADWAGWPRASRPPAR